MSAASDLAQEVADRADHRCEYCGMHDSLQGATFHLEHVLPRSRGGETLEANLAWACPSCNLRKSNRTAVSETPNGPMVPLFNPRTEEWNDHFQWSGHSVVGRTSTGRATVIALDLNHSRRLRVRQAEELFELFPPR